MTGLQTAVLVLMGGPDAEREVSLMSGRGVADALRARDGFPVVARTIDTVTAGELRAVVDAEGIDVVFPVLHGPWGEGGALQEVLEESGVAYVGSRPRAARLAMDKLATKTLAAAEGVPTPPARQLMPEDVCDLRPPLVLKPVDDGSSIDIRVCRTVEELAAVRAELHPKRGRLLAERYIAGRELTVGIVGDEALPVVEVVPADAVEFYDYEAKYEREDTRYIVNPDVPEEIARQCRQHALTVFRRLGCRHLARVDFMLDAAGPWLLEINTMPGFTEHSLVPMAAREVGLDLPALCARLVGLARQPDAVASLTSPSAS